MRWLQQQVNQGAQWLEDKGVTGAKEQVQKAFDWQAIIGYARNADVRKLAADWVGVAVGSCAACAQRLRSLEARLLGVAAADLGGVNITPADLASLAPIDDVRASAAYRLDATATLLQRTLRELAK